MCDLFSSETVLFHGWVNNICTSLLQHSAFVKLEHEPFGVEVPLSSSIVWVSKSTESLPGAVPFSQFLYLLIISGFIHSSYLLVCFCKNMSVYSNKTCSCRFRFFFLNTVAQYCLDYCHHFTQGYIFHVFKLLHCVLCPCDVALTIETGPSL